MEPEKKECGDAARCVSDKVAQALQKKNSRQQVGPEHWKKPPCDFTNNDTCQDVEIQKNNPLHIQPQVEESIAELSNPNRTEKKLALKN